MADYDPWDDTEFTKALDNLEIRLSVQAGFSIVVGAYSGPITREVIAENIQQMINDHGIGEFIEQIRIEEISFEDGPSIACSE